MCVKYPICKLYRRIARLIKLPYKVEECLLTKGADHDK